ncbi:hypothetical protein [Macrococcus carouselicus]|uniref:hypothetical protein n=1 Tax=Macrococcus carouselicus TaxID=69969 RepID=UPI00140E3865|nr:hypothetical protein [Macrococcus carouselicus]
MLSREDGKHYKKNELDELNIFELMEHEYRIIARKEKEEKQKELNQLEGWF